MFRIGIGYDVHAFDPSEDNENYLMIAGVKISHNKKLIAHSDGDVVLHALTDAMLGSIAEGNIGTHFPPIDDRWRNCASEIFVARAHELVKQKGYAVENVDITIICQEPRIMPHAIELRQNIARMLDLTIGQVSVKAVTTEGLGALGRREGVAAQAAVLIAQTLNSQNTGA